MEIAVRTDGMRVCRSISNTDFQIEGVDFEMFASGGLRNQAFAFDGLTSGLTENTGAIKQCRFALFSGGSAFVSKFAGQGIQVEYCTFESGIGFGMSTVPSMGANIYLYDYRIRNCLARDLSQTGFRMFGIRDAVLADIRCYRTSGGGDANTINFYQGRNRVVCMNVGMGLAQMTKRILATPPINRRRGYTTSTVPSLPAMTAAPMSIRQYPAKHYLCPEEADNCLTAGHPTDLTFRSHQTMEVSLLVAMSWPGTSTIVSPLLS